MRLIPFVAALGLGVAVAHPFAQEPQAPLFRSGLKNVAIYATVMGADGRLVPGLEAEDFEVLDEGKPVDLVLFDNRVQPFTAVLALDTSGSMTANIDRVQDAAEQFVIRMLPDDRAAVAYFNSRVYLSDRFTSDRDALVSYIRNDMRFGNDTVLWDAVGQSLDRLEAVDGRTVIVALTDGEAFGRRTKSDDVRTRAREQDVMCYSTGFTSDYCNCVRREQSRPAQGL